MNESYYLEPLETDNKDYYLEPEDDGEAYYLEPEDIQEKPWTLCGLFCFSSLEMVLPANFSGQPGNYSGCPGSVILPGCTEARIEPVYGGYLHIGTTTYSAELLFLSQIERVSVGTHFLGGWTTTDEAKRAWTTGDQTLNLGADQKVAWGAPDTPISDNGAGIPLQFRIYGR